MDEQAVLEAVQVNVHVRYNGQTWDLDGAAIDVGDGSTDAQVRQNSADALQAPVAKLANFSIERVRAGNRLDITLAPNATFGYKGKSAN